ncbi:hypothetical protein [Dyadobacter alkalitolerans]|uniref:hypothetical protein n=1 Tax=Dyadobacter alkalitolerans TaxID=492736 RepID=UPI0012F79FDA|nr:hypothetical protein [Dyadobacter alkalitolerans]
MIIAALALYNCKSDTLYPNTVVVPGQVYVLTKGEIETQQIFDLINEVNLPVKVMYGQSTHTSAMPKDSLSFIKRNINQKPYTNSGKDSSTVIVSVKHNAEVQVSPRLYSIDKKEYQNDWLETETALSLSKLKESDLYGFSVYFLVPEGSEEHWISKFKSYDDIVNQVGPVFEYIGN